MNSGNMLQKPAAYVDDDDIVSDDGRIWFYVYDNLRWIMI